MTTEDKTKQALMARYHHLKDHINDLETEIDSARKEMDEVAQQLFNSEE